MPTQTRRIVVIAVGLLVLIGLGSGAGQLAKRYPTRYGQNTSANNAAKVAPISYPGEAGKTVLELLQRDHQVATVDSSLGAYVKTIDGIDGTGNAAWIYYINGATGVEGADKAVTTGDQTIEWRYETF